MKRISTYLAALALGLSLQTANAGLTTDPLGIEGPQSPHPNAAAALPWLAGVLGELPAGQSARLSDLFLNPEFFDLMHATGPQADELRGHLDWLIMTGVVLGLDGDDGLDDFAGPVHGLDGDDGLDDFSGPVHGLDGDDGLDDFTAMIFPNGLTGDAGDDLVLRAPQHGFSDGGVSHLPGLTVHQPILIGGPANLFPVQPLNWSWGTTQIALVGGFPGPVFTP